MDAAPRTPSKCSSTSEWDLERGLEVKQEVYRGFFVFSLSFTYKLFLVGEVFSTNGEIRKRPACSFLYITLCYCNWIDVVALIFSPFSAFCHSCWLSILIKSISCLGNFGFSQILILISFDPHGILLRRMVCSYLELIRSY